MRVFTVSKWIQSCTSARGTVNTLIYISIAVVVNAIAYFSLGQQFPDTGIPLCSIRDAAARLHALPALSNRRAACLRRSEGTTTSFVNFSITIALSYEHCLPRPRRNFYPK